MGNVGSAVAAVTLPTLAILFGGEDGWRYAMAVTGVIALIYAGLYYQAVSDTPAGSTYFKPKGTMAEIMPDGSVQLIEVHKTELIKFR